MDFEGRVSRLRPKLDEHGLDALLVTNLTNVRYLTGFSGTNGQMLVTGSQATFLSDPRYRARAADLVRGAEIAIYPARLTDVLVPMLREAGIKRLGVEAKTMTIADRDDLEERLGDVELAGTTGLIEDPRRVKEASEIALIKEAVALGDRFLRLLERLTPGVSERQVALEIEVTMRGWGADEVSFPPIVGSGPLSAHIHHTPGDRELQKGDLVLLDFGCRWQGYCSDSPAPSCSALRTTNRQRCTTLSWRRSEPASRRWARARGDRRSTPERELSSTRPVAVLSSATGLATVSGWTSTRLPGFTRISEDTLAAGDVVTVEPGVYLQGSGGVRIEDCVLVTAQGPRCWGPRRKTL